MLDKLKNLNIETCSDDELKIWIRQALPVVDTFLKASRKLANIDSNTNEHGNQMTLSERDGNSQYIFIANGRNLPIQQLSDINEEDFDVIMDTTTNSLRFRKDPIKRTKLRESELEKVGSHRMRILAYMLEHPDKPFHCNNIYKAYTSMPDINEPNTFTKTIGALRRAIGQTDTSGPYIVKHFDWDGISGLNRSCIYKINSEWRYLLVRHRNISEQIPL